MDLLKFSISFYYDYIAALIQELMWVLYQIIVFLGQVFVRVFAGFNKRIGKWRKGQKGLLQKIAQEVDPAARYTWFHFASLGEFEQGRSVLEAYRKQFPSRKIVMTFFSPSGYEVRANYPQADHVFYMPMDTLQNARKFVSSVPLDAAFFVKYEFWPNFFQVLHEAKVPLYLISGIFRKDQVFFKWYGGFFRQTLKRITHFFVQDEASRSLLASIGIKQVTQTGDTRFDRVATLPKQVQPIAAVKTFLGDHPVLVAGSTWPPDEVILASLHQQYPTWKFIIAPHQISKTHLEELKRHFDHPVLFSELWSSLPTEASILVIDNVGMLSALYAYADIAYIGGGFGVGIHNTLEAATYGVPVIFGPAYHKFKEAKDLIQLGAACSVKEAEDLQAVFQKLQLPTARAEAGKRAFNYVQEQAGATQKIMDFLIGKQLEHDNS